MRRFVAFAVIAALSNTSIAFAGETLRSVAERVTRDANSQASPSSKPIVPTAVQKNWGNSLMAMQEGGAVSASGMRKRTKVLIYLAAAVGVVGTWYAIDHRVEDNTPSTLGTRQD
jgi:hypothetical protein